MVPEKFEDVAFKDIRLNIIKQRGDIYLLDERYEDALLEYQKCIEVKSFETNPLIYPEIYISMGITYEK